MYISLSLSVYIYIYMYVCVYIYIYIYVYIYIYIYIDVRFQVAPRAGPAGLLRPLAEDSPPYKLRCVYTNYYNENMFVCVYIYIYNICSESSFSLIYIDILLDKAYIIGTSTIL